MTKLADYVLGASRLYKHNGRRYHGGAVENVLEAWWHICDGTRLFLWVGIKQCKRCRCERDRMLRAEFAYS